MPLGLMHGKWDGISMASPPLHSYKHERPAYSTPQPVENTPANNECRMVELRGAKVASFFVGGDEFICLPQAFDLFLKHLVGGLHTVYTKLKRLSISPVVCNVEQVRVLRGLGAIQPGVNRCKLITRKDFEILYQDCTQASRPGRPPKRYPMLPPTNDLMSHHAGLGTLNSHGILTTADLNNLHKRMRLDQDIERNLHQREQERRPSDSATKDSANLLAKNLAMPGSNEIHASAANLYLQAHQALRQQYQQVASSGIHNGMESHHRVSPTGMNPALAPLMMMSHPALFSGAIPPGMLNHINKFAQDHGTSSVVSNAAAAAAAQIAANGGNMQQQAAAAYQMAAAAQSAAHATLAAAAASASNSSAQEENRSRISAKDEKMLDTEKRDTPRGHTSTGNISLSEQQNGIDNDILGSPQSSVSSLIEGEIISNGSLSDRSDSVDSFKYRESHAEVSRHTPTPKKDHIYEHQEITNQDERNEHNENEKMPELDDETGSPNDRFVANDNAQSQVDNDNISSMQTLLTNIQGLLKVAADNARLQEKQSSLEIADLKTRMVQERQIRSVTEKKLQESERIGALIHKRLKKERKVRKLLQEQLRSMQQQIGSKNDESAEKIASAPAMPIRGSFGSGREASENAPLLNEQLSPRNGSPSRAGATSPATSDKARSSSTLLETSTSFVAHPESHPQTSPLKSEVFEQFTSSHLVTNVNNSNNNHIANEDIFLQNGDSQMATPPGQFSEGCRESFEHESGIGAMTGKRDFVDRIPMPAARMFFGAAHFQSTVSQ